MYTLIYKRLRYAIYGFYGFYGVKIALRARTRFTAIFSVIPVKPYISMLSSFSHTQRD